MELLGFFHHMEPKGTPPIRNGINIPRSDDKVTKLFIHGSMLVGLSIFLVISF